MTTNTEENKGDWFDASWARIFIGLILGRIIQVNFFPDVGMVIVLPLTVAVVYLIWEGVTSIRGKKPISSHSVDEGPAPLWKKVAAFAAAGLVFVIMAVIVKDMFGPSASSKTNIVLDDNQEFMRKELEAMNGSMPQMMDADSRLDTAFASPNGKMNYKYTLVNYTGNDIDFTIFRDEVLPSVINGYCTHPDLQNYRERNIPMVYQYFGSDGVFIGSFEANIQGCN